MSERGVVCRREGRADPLPPLPPTGEGPTVHAERNWCSFYEGPVGHDVSEV